jgi:hypothetical protein
MSGIDIEIDGDSEAAVALALTRMLLEAEDAPEEPTRMEILRTFTMALAAVRGELEVEEADDEEDEDDENEPAKG